MKVDLATCEEQVWWEEDKLVSEPVFIAAPGASEEDQGVVLSAILDKVKHVISYIVWNECVLFHQCISLITESKVSLSILSFAKHSISKSNNCKMR